MDLSSLYEFAEDFSRKHDDLIVEIGYSLEGDYQSKHFGRKQINFVFDIASVSKAVQTTYLLMIFTQENEINTEDCLGKFNLVQDNFLKSLKVSELLTHVSGLKAWWPFYLFEKNSDNIVSYIDSAEFYITENRGKRVYSDIGFILLGKIIEKITNKSLKENFIELIKKPLSLKNTFYQDDLGDRSSYQTSLGNPFEKAFSKKLGLQAGDSHFRVKRIQNVVNDQNCFKVFNGIAGHCGLFSNVEDLNIIGNSLINNTLVSESVCDLFLNSLMSKNAYGMLADPQLMKFKLNENWRGHHGFTGCSFFINKKEKKVLSFLSNRQVCGLDDSGNYPNWKLE